MTVIKRFRSESKLEVLHTAQRLRRDITFLMLHDFGVRPKVRELQLETKGMSPEDGQMFLAIAEKYGISKADAEWPSWLIGKIRDSLFEILRQLVLHVTAANSIYPAEFADAELRRKHQDAAIACCAQLYQELEFSMSVLPVDITRYAPFLDEVDKETALIKGWRKSDRVKSCSDPVHKKAHIRQILKFFIIIKLFTICQSYISGGHYTCS